MFARDLAYHQLKEDEVVFPGARYLLGRATTNPVLTQFFVGEAEQEVFTHATLSAQTEELIGLLPGLRRAKGRARALSVVSALSAEQLGTIGMRLGGYRSSGGLQDPAGLAQQGLGELGKRADLG